MKRFAFALRALGLSVLLCSCSGILILSPHNLSGLNADGAVILYMQYETYSPDMEYVTVFIRNNSVREVAYGDPWELEVMKNGIWYHVPFVRNMGWNDIAYTLHPGDINSQKLRLGALDYSMRDGVYRVIKEIGGVFSSVQFNIGQSDISAKTPFGFAPLEELPEDYSAADAVADGVIFVGRDKIHNGDRIASFIFNVSAGAEDMLRTAAYTDEGDIILTDIIYASGICGQRFLVRVDATRDKYGGGIHPFVYGYLVTDGERIYLSDYPEYQRQDARLLIPYYGDWDGWAPALPLVEDMTSQNLKHNTTRYKSWSRDGTRYISLTGKSLSYDYMISDDGGYFGSSGVIADKMDIAASIRKVEWIDGTTAMFVCDTDSELAYYEFIDTDTLETVAYTAFPAENGYMLTPDRVTIYGGSFEDSFTYPPLAETN